MKLNAKFIAIRPSQPPRSEIKHRLALYEKDLAECQLDLKRRHRNGNPPDMPNAVHLLRAECRRRIAHYIPAIKELKWVMGLES